MDQGVFSESISLEYDGQFVVIEEDIDGSDWLVLTVGDEIEQGSSSVYITREELRELSKLLDKAASS